MAAYGDQKLNDAMKLIIEESPSEFRSSRMGKVATNKSGQVTIDTLANLRLSLNMMKDRYRMSQARAESTKLNAYNLEDLVKAKTAGTLIHWSLLNRDSTRNEYLWYCVYRPYLLKFAALLTALLSILSFIGVISSMTGVPSTSSPYFLAVHQSNASAVGIVLFIFVTLGYTAYVTLWSLFQMRLEGYVELVPGRTTPESLSFNVRMCAKLAAPLAFFYLGWIAENGLDQGHWTHNNGQDTSYYTNVTMNTFNSTTNTTTSYNETILITQTNAIFMPSAFSNFYQLQSIHFIQQTFGTIFPCILYGVIALILPNLMNRILVCMKLPGLQFGTRKYFIICLHCG